MEQFCSTFDQACTRTLKPEFFIRQFIRGNIAKKVLRINLIILICSNKGILELKISNIYIFKSFFFVKIILKNPTRIANNIYLSIRTQIVVINFYKNKKKCLDGSELCEKQQIMLIFPHSQPSPSSLPNTPSYLWTYHSLHKRDDEKTL